MENKGSNLIVGIFVAAGSILIFVFIILLGQERSIFESSTTLYVAFDNVAGLKPGSQVRLSGVVVGSVTDIDFSPALSDKKLHVELEVATGMMPRIRKDSVATVSTKGLLGDKVVEITIGSSEAEALKSGDYLPGREPPDIFQILEKGQTLISAGADVAENLKIAIKKFTDDENVSHIKGIIASIDNVLNEIESGDGVAHGLIYDRQVNADLKSTMSNVATASASVKRSVDHIENVVAEVRTGEGLVHGLVYGDDGKAILKNVRDTSASLAEVVEAVKTRQGMLHTLIYEEDKGNIIKNLNEASEDIRKLAAYMESGKGTIGALIKDPTIFEDLKLILGNLKRNSSLKTLIRLSLDSQEADPGPKAGDSRLPPSTVDRAAKPAVQK
ncbi:MAG: MCE family protein [Myxococcales bacterium]|nr:MAG: MCE family protein [Myxococcales bacterium]